MLCVRSSCIAHGGHSCRCQQIHGPNAVHTFIYCQFPATSCLISSTVHLPTLHTRPQYRSLYQTQATMCKSSGVTSMDAQANFVAASYSSNEEDTTNTSNGVNAPSEVNTTNASSEVDNTNTSDLDSPFISDENSLATRSQPKGRDITTTEKENQRQIQAEQDSEESKRRQADTDATTGTSESPGGDLDSSASRLSTISDR